MSSRTVWVQMTISISGGRADGRVWPPSGGTIDIPEDEAVPLVRAGNAIWANPPHIPHVPLPGPASQVPAPVSEPAETAAGPVITEDGHDRLEAVADGAEDPQEPADLPSRPKPADPKSDWLDYAVSRGADPDDAVDMTKAELMQEYGGRL